MTLRLRLKEEVEPDVGAIPEPEADYIPPPERRPAPTAPPAPEPTPVPVTDTPDEPTTIPVPDPEDIPSFKFEEPEKPARKLRLRLKEAPVAEPAPVEEDKPNVVSNVARGIGERGVELVGGTAGTIGRLAEGAGDWLDQNLGKPVWDENGLTWRRLTPEESAGTSSWITQKLAEVEKGMTDPDFGYDPRTTWEDVKNAPVTNIIPFAVEQGLVSLPDMVAAVKNAPAYVIEQAGEIGAERAKNDNRPEASFGDIIKAMPAATVSAMMEKLGTQYLFGKFAGGEAVLTELKQLPAELFKVLLTEGGTEAAQQASQYTGGHAFTEKGMDWWELAEQTAQAAVVGAIFGPTVRTGTGVAEIATSTPAQPAGQGQGTPATPNAAVGQNTPGTQGSTTTPSPPAGAASGHTEEAGKDTPATAAATPTVSVVPNGSVDPGIAAAQAPATPTAPAAPVTPVQSGTGSTPLPDPDTGDDGLTDTQRSAASSWAQQYVTVDSDNAAALEETPAAPASKGRGRPKKVVETATPAAAPDATVTEPTPGPTPTPTPAPAAATSSLMNPAAAATQGTAPSPVATPASPVAEPAPSGEAAAVQPAAQRKLKLRLKDIQPISGAEPSVTPIVSSVPAPPEVPQVGTITAGMPQVEQPVTPIVSAVPAAAEEVTEEIEPPRKIRTVPRHPIFGGQVAQPAVETAPAPAPVATAPKAELIKAKAAAKAEPAAPTRTVAARQLSDEVTQELDKHAATLGADVLEHPKLAQFVDELSDAEAATIKKGEPPAKAVTGRVAKVIGGLKERVAQDERQRVMDEHDKETEARQKAQDINERRLTGKPIEEGAAPSKTAGQQKARARTTDKVIADVAATWSEDTWLRKAKANPDDPVLAKWLKSFDQRKAVGKGSSKKQKALRAPHTLKMREAEKEYVAAQESQGKTMAAKRAENEAKAREVEERKAEESSTQGKKDQRTREEREQEARELARAKPSDAAAITRRSRTAKVTKPAFESVAPAGDRIMADRDKTKSYIGHYVSTIEAALKKAGETLSEKRNRAHLSPQENLAIYGKELLSGKHPGHTTVNFFTAQMLLKSGTTQDIKNFNELISESSQGTAESLGITGVSASVSATADQPFTDKKTGDKFTPTVIRKTTGSKVLTEATSQFRAEKPFMHWLHGAYDIVRRQHGKALNRMVGNTPVRFISHEDMQRMYPDARGVFVSLGNRGRAYTGEQGDIFINQNIWDGLNAQERVELIQHEMTHAATSFAIDNNIRGTKDIIDKLRKSLQLQLNHMYGGIPNEYRHAFSDAKEFVTAALTKNEFQKMLMTVDVPAELRAGIDLMMQGRTTPTWWQMVTRAVSNALGIYHPTATVNNYFEQVLKIQPHIMQSTERQAELSKIADEFPHADPEKSQEYAERFGKDALRRLRAGAMIPNQDPFNADPYLASMEASMDAVYQKARSLGGRAADWIGTRALSTHMLKREYQDELGGKTGGFAQLVDQLMSHEHERNQMAEAGRKLANKFIDYTRANPVESAKLTNIAQEASTDQYDPSELLSHDGNSHITKKGKRDHHVRLAHARGRAEFLQMSQDGQDMFRDLRDHFRDEENDRRQQLTYNILHHANDADPFAHKLPAGWTVDRLVNDWVMNGRVDRPLLPGSPVPQQPNQRTPEDQDIHNALGKTAATLAGVADLRGIKGMYLPMLREGSHVLSAVHDVATPAGAFKDKATGSPDDQYINDFVFGSERELKAYLAANSAKPTEQRDQIYGKVGIEHRDPSTWKKVNPNDAAAHTFYRVTVQNKIVEMSDDRTELEQLKKDYDAKGFKADLVGRLEKDVMYGTRPINSQQINQLIRSAQQGTGAGTASRKMLIAGINDMYLRSLAGQRASNRRLKRKAVKGYNRDIIDTLLQHNRTMSGYRANLKRSVPMARAEKAVADLLKSMQKNQYGSQDRFYRLQSAVQEVQARITQSNERNERTTGARLINNIMAVAAIKHLASPAYHIINAVSGPTMAYSLAAARHGYIRTGIAQTKAYAKLGGHRIVGKGLKETAKEGVSAGKALYGTLRGDKLAALSTRTREDYEAFLVRRLNGDPLQDVFEKGQAELKRLSLGANAGIEAPELDEASMNAAEKAISRSSRVTRAAGEAVEHVNRSHALLMYLDLAKQDGMTDEQAVDYAVGQVERTQGGYAAENQQRIMNLHGLKAFTQFRKYGAMYASAYYNAITRMIKPGDRKVAAKEFLNMSLMGAAMAGTSGLALQEVAHAFAMVFMGLSGSDDTWEDVKNWQQEYIQSILGRKWGELITRGLPRALNIDVSDRMAQDSLVLYGDPKSYAPDQLLSYFADMFLGAGGGLFTEGLFKTFREADTWSQGITDALPLPKILGDIKKAVERVNEPTKNQYGTITGEQYSTGEAVTQGLGFAPASRAREYEPGGVGYKRIQDAKIRHERTVLMGKVLDKTATRADIREFNRTHAREHRIDIGDLHKSRRTRKQHEREDRNTRRRAQMELAE